MTSPKVIYFPFYALFLTLLSVPMEASAYTLPSVVVRASSDSIYHGSSENAGEASIAINAELPISANWIAGLQFQDSNPSGVRQRHRNISGYLGFDKKIAKNWLSSTYFTHRAFPGSGRTWDYDEFTTRLTHQNGLSFGTFYAPNYYSSSVKALGANIQYTGRLVDRFYWRSQAGNINIPSLFSYQYADFTVGTSYKRINVELGYHWTSETLIQTSVGTIDSPDFVLSVNYVVF
ncbi:hypothetical protein EYS14_01955 [Alteromonadaceae bacterium M269]|nr:hypothetical protein EYS14_01955 [Alteromonadaceae bacterium M269]